METDNTKAHLCDTCEQASSFPECLPENEEDIEYGNSFGGDNIIKCSNYL